MWMCVYKTKPGRCFTFSVSLPWALKTEMKEDLDKRKSRFIHYHYYYFTPMEREQDDRTGRCNTRLIKMERGLDQQAVRK